jgi:hypothetical protein
MDGHREQEPLHRRAADLALLDRVVGHPLKTLELVLTRKATVLVRRQG